MTFSDPINAFLSGESFAVVGASNDRNKYGNKVLRAYLQRDLTVFPVNPKEETVEGLAAYASLGELPANVHGVSFVTPAAITEQVLAEAVRIGIRHVWMQPGAESQTAIEAAESAGMNVIAGGPCILVSLGYRES